ncbi:DUF2526 family protein [Erwinia sp. MMLR14_017]|uniref:DUF2526 family protein n=1 Tax=Erwinia sp. MMLR14_017 TaxID=3093842 RepID=UPI00298FCE6E|nr:DUF2526 family protein [Erwinia sp. MMLR14_017]MDW8847712.1 DUF2526 family protein [Erwinia sp. MMLR14_017]
MTHIDEIVEAVNAAIRKNVIRDMNVLLCELSDDHRLTREQRFEQQQRLRLAVFRHTSEKEELAEQRRNWLTHGGIIR